ncbi:helix-turn-helix domain-containing protein [Embleya hyalina]|uniref:Transcriptional regulator n=1 Tax=Embleya hyalina TaxID=516124 RepID=A0A401YV01_9ACTN|nr:XRE family transcriptional regulator [Embleya hyalina]GCD98434.1 transcriptional regulator [Embleya hyalina]
MEQNNDQSADPGQPAVSRAIAANVRAARTARGWSLEALAARGGLSKGALVGVEQGRGNPGVLTLARIADALGLPLTGLVDGAPAPLVEVLPAAGGTRLWRGEHGGHGDLLIGSDPPVSAELWRWTLAPGDAHVSAPHGAGVRELLTVLAGVLTLDVAGTRVDVPADACARFAADRPHTYRNDGTSAVRFVGVVLLPGRPDPATSPTRPTG